MAVSREPILKRCRYLGISPMVMGISKESNRNPGANNRKKLSEYGMQLKEKAGDNLVTCLESRLDSVVFRMGLALTRREARQLVTHKHFTVNGVRVDIPSYRVKVGDVIALHDTSKSSQKFKDVVEQTADRTVPLWLDVNKEAFSATVTRMPVPEDLDYEVAAHLIVELYSK